LFFKSHKVSPFLAHPFQKVIADAQRVGHDRQRGIHRAARRKEARIHDIEIVKIVRLTVDIENGGLRIPPEPHGAVLVRDAGQRYALSDIRAEVNDFFRAVHVFEQTLQLGL
jgi:hypothetical protein